MNLRSLMNRINNKHIAIAVIAIIGIAYIVCVYWKNDFISNITDKIYDTLGIKQNSTTNESMASVSNGNKNAKVVLYYASWCGYSKQFLPEWEKFVKSASNSLPNIQTQAISCENGTEKQCAEQGVEGYPTILVHLDNRVIAYDGERSAKALTSYCKKM